MAQNYGLGRGLSSLIPSKKPTNQVSQDKDSGKINAPRDDFNYFGKTIPKAPSEQEIVSSEISQKETGEAIQKIKLAEIVPNPNQPRKNFDQKKLSELAVSIKEHGIIQPIVINPQKEGGYQIIAGERRYQAAKLAGVSEVPAILRESDEKEKLELAMVENIQRQDLNPIEEAKSYLKLSEKFDMDQGEIAKKMGISRSGVANKLRLLKLPVEIQKALMEGKITEGHAKSILALSDPEKQRALYELIIKNKLTVRQTEGKAHQISVRPHKRNLKVDPATRQMEESLSQALGTKVKIKKSGQGGKIEIEYYSSEELEGILGKIKI